MTKGRTIIFYQTNRMLSNNQISYAILLRLQGQLGKKVEGKEEITYVKGQINRSKRFY